MVYLATFFSHFGAIRYKNLCEQAGFSAQLMPVPRSLSSSCGTCVQAAGGYALPPADYADEVDQIVRLDGAHYVRVYPCEEASYGD